MKKIAITGNIGTGKSTLIKLLKDKGLQVFDVDKINRELLNIGNKGYTALVLYFGEQVVLEDGSLDKEYVAQKVFNNKDIRLKVESLLHPLILDELNNQLGKVRSSLVFVEVPLLFEAKWDHFFDESWLLCASKEVVMSRLLNNRGMTLEDAVKRYDAQMPQDEKIKRADVVLWNNTSVEALVKQVEEHLQKERDV